MTGGDSGHFYRYCSDPWPYTVTSLAVGAGKTIRVVVAWPTNPDHASYATLPSSDFDIRAYKPGGSYSWSASWDNTYEIVEFVAPWNGLYTLEVRNLRCEEPTTGTRIGWAWARSI